MNSQLQKVACHLCQPAAASAAAAGGVIEGSCNCGAVTCELYDYTAYDPHMIRARTACTTCTARNAMLRVGPAPPTMAACEPADSVGGPPMAVVICHCQDCREAHGSPMSTVFLAAANKVTYNSAPTTHLPSCLASTAALRSHDRLTQGAFLLSRWRSRLPGRVRSPWHEQAWLLQRMWHPHELKPLQEWPLRYGHGGHTCGSLASADLFSR